MFSINSLFKCGFTNKNAQKKRSEFSGANLKPLSKDTVSFGSSVNAQQNPLNRYTKYNKSVSNGLIRLKEFDLLTFQNYKGKNELHSAWKIHIYANNEQDMFDLQNSVGQYLIDNKINWKTTVDYSRLRELSTGEQKGKAITIYPESVEAFKKIAHDVDYIIKNNGLRTQNSSIQGDRQLGDSGRIFYRYEYNSGKLKDRIFDLEREEDEYDDVYERNRGGNNYLASDMTIQDDPFIYFNPSAELDIEEKVQNRKVSKLETCETVDNKYKLRKNEIFPLKYGTITLFESDDHQHDCQVVISNDVKLRCMRNGGVLTIGKGDNCDIIAGKDNTYVSRCHAKIYKQNDRFYIEDVSTNGTRVYK